MLPGVLESPCYHHHRHHRHYSRGWDSLQSWAVFAPSACRQSSGRGENLREGPTAAWSSWGPSASPRVKVRLGAAFVPSTGAGWPVCAITKTKLRVGSPPPGVGTAPETPHGPHAPTPIPGAGREGAGGLGLMGQRGPGTGAAETALGPRRLSPQNARPRGLGGRRAGTGDAGRSPSSARPPPRRRGTGQWGFRHPQGRKG